MEPLGPRVAIVLRPLQMATLVLLHVVFALCRLFVLVKRLFARAALEYTRARRRAHPPRDEQRTVPLSFEPDSVKKRWSKLPSHVAIVFVDCTWWNVLRIRASGLVRWTMRDSHAAGDDRDVQEDVRKVKDMVKDVDKLVRWCEQLEIREVSLYDDKGLLDKYADVVASLLGRSFPTDGVIDDVAGGFKKLKIASNVLMSRSKRINELALPRGEVDSGCGVSDAGPEGALTPTTLSKATCITINLLSRRSGQIQLATVAQTLARARQKGIHTVETITTELVTETIENSSFGDPQLMLVLGGPYLRLHGFPPWQIKLTEMLYVP
ncbi:hypothetical protein OIV83_004085 [Microbotryomycetes sp. JL201]|nr:hypothetical protein OIV83_004085 [Microbotryomycetes sp. JL201]